MYRWQNLRPIAGTALLLLIVALPLKAHDSDLVPPRVQQQPVTAATAGELLYYDSEHDLDVGDRGEESFDLSVEAPDCNEEALVFHQARIMYKRQRFGEASIVRKPPSGCLRCSPLVVRWYHEPTGFVDFQVHIYRKRVVGACPAQ